MRWTPIILDLVLALEHATAHIRRVLVLSAIALVTSVAAIAQQPPAAAPKGWSADLTDLRRLAATLPGAKPLRINVLKFAESHRTKNFAVKGEPNTPRMSSRIWKATPRAAP